MRIFFILFLILFTLEFFSCQTPSTNVKNNLSKPKQTAMKLNCEKTDAEWKKQLTSEQYEILRLKITLRKI